MTKRDKVTVNDIIGLVDCEPTNSVEEVKKLRGRENKTEKRFTTIYNEHSEMKQYVDNQKEEPNRWAIWNASETVQKLNNLNDENEQLKKDCTVLIYHNQEYRKENEQLNFKLEEVRSDEKQLGISFMEFKMKLIEKLQVHYDYATEQKQKNLNDIFVAKAYDIIRYDIKKLAEEMGVDFE